MSPQHSDDDLRNVWFSAFAAATVALSDWYPGGCGTWSTEDLAYLRRKRAKQLADKAVQDVSLLDSDADYHILSEKKK